MNLPEPLEIVASLRLHLQSGQGATLALRQILENRPSEFSRSLRIWQARMASGQIHHDIMTAIPSLSASPARKSLLHVLQRGALGHPIDHLLESLQTEFLFIMEQDLERHVQLLPLKLLLPLALFILPAVMILLLGPLLSIFNQGF